MHVVFVLTYPVYHSVPDVAEWLRWENRDRWMPGIISALGCEAEIWAVAREAHERLSSLAGLGNYRIRLFATSGGGKKSRNHYSDVMIEAARAFHTDFFVLVGVDGGAGLRLFRHYLRPEVRRFAVVIGGDCYGALVTHADIVFYESEVQRRVLLNSGWRIWRRAIPPERLI